MESFNHVVLSGNISQLTLHNSGQTSVLKFSVAVNDRKKEGDNWVDVPNFIECVMFGNRADAMSQRMAKGDRVQLTGSLRQSTYEKEGQKRSKVEVNVKQIEVRPKHKETAQEVYEQKQQEMYDDEIPF